MCSFQWQRSPPVSTESLRFPSEQILYPAPQTQISIQFLVSCFSRSPADETLHPLQSPFQSRWYPCLGQSAVFMLRCHYMSDPQNHPVRNSLLLSFKRMVWLLSQKLYNLFVLFTSAIWNHGDSKKASRLPGYAKQNSGRY